MSINLGLRHDRLLREQAAQMFEKGCGYRLTAKRLGVSAATVREWQKMYRAIGRSGFLAMGISRPDTTMRPRSPQRRLWLMVG